jgi:PilZ domain
LGRRRKTVILVSEIVGFALPIILLPMVLAFWKRHDAVGIDARKDRKTTRKRLTPRVNVNWPASIRTVMGTVRGRVIDVGDQGAGLLCVQPLSPTEVIHMTLEIPGHPVEAEAEVVRCDTRHRARREAPYHGIGVFFRSISDEDRAFLAALVEASISEKTTENIQKQKVFAFRPKARSKVPLRQKMLTR